MEKGEDKIIEYLEIMNKNNQANLEKYLGVLNEQHSEDLKAIKEYMKISQDKFDRIDNKLELINKKLDSHTEMIGSIALDLHTKVDKKDFNLLKEQVTQLA